MKKLAFLVIAVLLSSFSLSAQRTAKGQGFIGLDGAYAFSKGAAVGADLEYGQYLLNSYWDAGICGVNRTNPAKVNGKSDGLRVNYTHYMVYGDWMYRALGTRTRSVNLYVGAGVYMGYEDYGKLIYPSSYTEEDKDGLTLNNKDGFLYGIRAQVLGEFFVSQNIAITVRGRVPINWCSATGWVKYEAAAGIRYLF